MGTKFNRLRDTIAHAIANFALNYIATKRYRDLVGALIIIGMNTADKEDTK